MSDTYQGCPSLLLFTSYLTRPGDLVFKLVIDLYSRQNNFLFVCFIFNIILVQGSKQEKNLQGYDEQISSSSGNSLLL